MFCFEIPSRLPHLRFDGRVLTCTSSNYVGSFVGRSPEKPNTTETVRQDGPRSQAVVYMTVQTWYIIGSSKLGQVRSNCKVQGLKQTQI
jgi:hypothetical protein